MASPEVIKCEAARKLRIAKKIAALAVARGLLTQEQADEFVAWVEEILSC